MSDVKVGIRGKGIIFYSLYKDDNYRVGHKISISNFTLSLSGEPKPSIKAPLLYEHKNEDGKWESISRDKLPDYVKDELLKEKI